LAWRGQQQSDSPEVLSSAETAVRQVRRRSPIRLAWDWRWELEIVTVTAGLSAAIAADLGLVWLAVIAGAGLAAFGALMRWPSVRKRIIARAWCIITPHRIRVGCVNAWIQTPQGRLPVVLSAVPTGFGERVQLWCPNGITAADLFAARDVLAAACWAAEVRVVPGGRRPHVITLEVIRNQPSSDERVTGRVGLDTYAAGRDITISRSDGGNSGKSPSDRGPGSDGRPPRRCPRNGRRWRPLAGLARVAGLPYQGGDLGGASADRGGRRAGGELLGHAEVHPANSGAISPRHK
jgi:hypothetical protein